MCRYSVCICNVEGMGSGMGPLSGMGSNMGSLGGKCCLLNLNSQLVVLTILLHCGRDYQLYSQLRCLFTSSFSPIYILWSDSALFL